MSHDEWACYNSPLHCAGCGEDEPLQCYLRCFECGHRWQRTALLAAHNAILDRLNAENALFRGDPLFGGGEPMPYERDVTQVSICPVCIHDF